MESETTRTFNLPDIPSLSFICYDSLDHCQADWDLAAFNGPNVLCEAPFLNAVSQNFKNDMRQFYTIFHMDGAVVGRAMFQCGLWEADSSYQDEESAKSSFSVKNWFAKKVKFIGILCGNILLTGEYGFDFDFNKVDKNKVPNIIGKVAAAVKEVFYKDTTYSSAVIGKDMDVTEELNSDWVGQGYHHFSVQPNMILDLHADWASFDDYLSSMTSKYRVRAKRAYKKSKDISFREFDEAEIEKHLYQIYEYFLDIQQNAGFNLVHLKPEYFLELKRHLDDRYKLFGYFLEGRLVGFNTVIINHNELEAHFLGFDKEINGKHQLYLTMLYDKVKKAINLGSKRIVFARTAMEIKSSVGATPKELCIYLRHENRMLNKVVSPIISVLNPEEKWVQRHPFKERS